MEFKWSHLEEVSGVGVWASNLWFDSGIGRGLWHSGYRTSETPPWRTECEKGGKVTHPAREGLP